MATKGTQKASEWRLSLEHSFSRRRFLQGTCGLFAGMSFLAACGGDSDTNAREETTGDETSAAPQRSLEGIDEFIIANFGGTTGSGMESTWGRLFTERTGIPVSSVFADYAQYRAQLESGNVSMHWIDADGWLAHNLNAKGQLENLDYDYIGVTEDDMVDVKFAYLPYAVASYLTTYVIGYRTEGDRPHPQSWQEFFDPQAVPGKRCLYNWPYGMVEAALMGDGVAHGDLYPLDLDRAFAKIDSIRGDLIFWNTGAESQQFLVSEAADFVVGWNNRFGYLARAGLPVDIEWSESLQLVNHHIVPKGHPNKDVAFEFIKAALDPPTQAECALLTGLAPTREGALDLVDDSMKPWMASLPENAEKGAGKLDDEWWAENIDEVTTAWFEFVGG